MRYRTFLTYNLIGAFCWAVGVTTLGHFLGNIGFVRDNIEIAVLGVVAISLMPVAFEIIRNHRRPTADAEVG